MNDKIDFYKELLRFSNDLERTGFQLSVLEHDISVLEKELSSKKLDRDRHIKLIDSTKAQIKQIIKDV
jgi:hypothetical protein